MAAPNKALRGKTVLHAEHDETRTVRFGDGREFSDVLLAVTPEAMDKINHGAICAFCLEPQESPWPTKCSMCSFPIASQQLQYLQSRRVGDMHIGSRINLADEAERLRELNDFEKKTGAVLPDHVKYPTTIIEH